VNEILRPPAPPFNEQTAKRKVRLAEAAWNTQDPVKVASAYSTDSKWRNRDEFLQGHEQIVAFLTRKWERELDYALRKELWAWSPTRIAVRFQYEWHDRDDQWFRSYGNENWEFNSQGLMITRQASINDTQIQATERRIFGARPENDETALPLQ
jgi:uncharacterized protein